MRWLDAQEARAVHRRRALSPHLQALASAPAAPADVHGFDEMVWASEQVSRLMLAPGGAGLRSHDWVCDQGAGASAARARSLVIRT